MKHNKQTQTEEQQYFHKTSQKPSKNLQIPLNDQRCWQIKLNSSQKRSHLQLLRLRGMSSQIHDKPQRKKCYDIKSRKNHLQQLSELEVQKQLDMWCTLMQPQADDFQQMGDHDIAYALKTHTVVKIDISAFKMFSEGAIGNQKNELKEPNQVKTRINEQKQKSFQKLNEIGAQVVKVVKQERPSKQMNNFSSEASNQHSGYHY